MLELVSQPWPWYVAGPLIGLTVPLLLLLGNKSFGISSSFRHFCAMCFPGKIPFFHYDWQREIWNMVFVIGILIGGFVSVTLLSDPNPIVVNAALQTDLSKVGVTDYSSLAPKDLFNWESLFTLRGFILTVVGGFLVGFGTRYAGGCTSGHSIMGLSNLQLPSLIATICFMIGGFVMVNLLMPIILSL